MQNKDEKLQEQDLKIKKQKDYSGDARANSSYGDYKPRPNNNNFFESRSNPLSSKGN
jgi:hypothetical protein